jgi:N-glycosylase/DNA lyase
MVSTPATQLKWLLTTQVWQIAQRDYKFGKGKHSSLTKGTYDAIANNFRGLWGKEAGWAHSVLFTADLKTFSERLVAKAEVTSEDIIIKDERGVITDVKRKAESKLTAKRIKREPGDDGSLIVETTEQTVKKTKRRRKL